MDRRTPGATNGSGTPESSENLGEQPALPTADTLKWSDFKKIDERKEAGIDAAVAHALKGEVDDTPKVTNRVAGDDIEYAITIDAIDAKKLTSTFDAARSYYFGDANTGDAGARLLTHLLVA